MSSSKNNIKKPHAICIPFPAQGHINPMLSLAKLLHHRNFHITFVNTEYNHRRLLRSHGDSALEGLPDFRFATIPDGLPPSNEDVTQDVPSLCHSTTTTCLGPFCELIERINNNKYGGCGASPPVSCIVSDGVMSFTLKAAERFKLPEVVFWTNSACGVMGYAMYRKLVERGYVPLKDTSQLTDGYLDMVLDWVPGMRNVRLRDIPTFIRTTDPNDIMLNFAIQEVEAIPRAEALILNTFDDLEQDILNELLVMYPRIYTIGSLQSLTNNLLHDQRLDTLKSSLWKPDSDCIEWLDKKKPESVIYVNFGSVTVLTPDQLIEFAWGLANSEKPFLWIIRPDIVIGEKAILPPEFVAETKDRAMMISWCPQEQVLKHDSVGGFLTHCGWNSTLESVVGGKPMICWPFFAEQQTNCRFSCVEWGIGMEINSDVKRDDVEMMVRKLIDGEKGKKLREKAKWWKKKAEEAVEVGGSSYVNLDRMITEVLCNEKFAKK